MATGETSFILAGNIRVPSKPLVIHWVKTAWDNVGVDLIKKPSQVSGIGLNPDGSEDDIFGSIQANGVAAHMKEEVHWRTALLTKDEDDNYPFVDCKGDEELQTNEIVIVDDTD